MRKPGNAVQNQQFANTGGASSRQLVNTSVIISNPAALRTGYSPRGGAGDALRGGAGNASRGGRGKR